jgi:hypothetical protein
VGAVLNAYVILHLEKGIWTPIALPEVHLVEISPGYEEFSAVSADEIWMMGSENRSGNDSTELFADHMDGCWD